MKQRKILPLLCLLLVGLALFVAVLAPNQRAFAQSTTSAPINDPGATNATCETDGNPLDWIICPVFNGIEGIATYLFQNVIVPFLKIPPVSTNPQDGSFQVWSTFRIYGDIILVVAILVIVFGETIGGGVIDAYTVRKVLPRILLAAILINLSVYIVAALVDITNIIGNGIGDIIIAPFKADGTLNFNINHSGAAGVFGIGFIGLFAAGGSIAVTLFALFTSFSTVAFAAFLAILPIIFAILAVFITLIFRQGIILFLVMVSPVAFALYCLPNTEKIFRRWWDFLLEALMVYPIVIIIFAVADVLSGTILQANDISLTTQDKTSGQYVPSFVGHTLAGTIAFGLQFAPLFLVPFAFRMASGTLGKLHEAVTKGSTAMGGLAQKRSENHKIKYGDARTAAQQRLLSPIKSRRDAALASGHGVRRWAYDSFLTNRIAGSNPDAADSQKHREANERIGAITATGKDGVVRGLLVDKKTALAKGADGNYLHKGSMWRDDHADMYGRKIREFKTAGGSWVSEADVDKAQGEFGGNKYAFGAALSYEMTKATSQEEVDGLVSSYPALAKAQGLSDDQSYEAWTGAAYGNQQTNLQYKHMKWGRQPGTTQGGLNMDYNGLMKEVDEKKGSGQLAIQNADTLTTMQEGVVKARATLQDGAASDEDRKKAGDTLQRARRIANNLQGSAIRRGAGLPADDSGAPDVGGTGMPSYAPSRVQEEQERFITTALGKPTPATYYKDPGSGDVLLDRTGRPIVQTPAIPHTPAETKYPLVFPEANKETGLGVRKNRNQ